MIRRAPRATAFGLSAGFTRAAVSALRGRAPGGRDRWERKNHAGRTVELYAGAAAALSAAVGAGRTRPAAGLAVAVAGACGAYDDVLRGVRRCRRGR